MNFKEYFVYLRRGRHEGKPFLMKMSSPLETLDRQSDTTHPASTPSFAPESGFVFLVHYLFATLKGVLYVTRGSRYF